MYRRAKIAKRAIRYGAMLAIGATLIAGSGVSVAAAEATETGPDITTLELDHHGADIFPAGESRPTKCLDTTTLILDRDGADIPVGNWWGRSDDLNGRDTAAADLVQGPDITTLNLDRDGADLFAD